MIRLKAVAAIIALLATAWLGARASAAAEPVVLQLHGPASFQFAGYYAAQWKGFFAETGLTVEIRPGAQRGQPPFDVIREVAEGRAQFGTGRGELVIRAAQGQPLLLVAPIFQQSGAAVFYRSDGDFPSPASLVKAKLGRLPASDPLDIELATALRAEGVDFGRLKSLALEPGQAFAALADRSIDAVAGSVWEMPWLAREKGLGLKSFNPADYRVEFYGDGLFTTQRLAQSDAQTLRAFREAALKGWDYALHNPEEIAGRLAGTMARPAGIADPAGFARYQSDVARRLSRFADVPLGHSNPVRWNRIEASLLGVGAILRTTDPEEFVYDPDSTTRRRTDLRAIALFGAALGGAALVSVLLWIRRRRLQEAGVPADEAAQMPTAPIAPAVAELLPDPVGTASPGDLNAWLQRLEASMGRRLPRGVGFRLSLLPELWASAEPPQNLQPVILDLVTAAGADLKSGGELIIGTRNHSVAAAVAAEIPDGKPGDYARLTVRDNGPGLPERALARIFDRAVSRRPAVIAAREALRPLGGFVRVESAEGIGTAVHLYFPRAAAAADFKAAAAE